MARSPDADVIGLDTERGPPEGTTSAWVLRTWARFALIVGATWLYLGTASGWFWGITGGAVVAEWFVVRQLAREWSWEARATWWWSA
ncbi:hypothetical protein [Pseudonocardia alni]|uniref:Uncharacterized protein n=1 Tax=Pseudonocardia alni TaxID=33907 RepID=A0A852VY18_PSEA5|nr:hypothetical protein [Pseudonocardia antarctica]NYG01079.1 hypothetical protein [Pseudonocardia antarctica]